MEDRCGCLKKRPHPQDRSYIVNLSGGEESKKISHRCFMNVICDKKCTKVLFLAKAFF